MYGSFTLNTKNVNKTHLSQLNLILETFILTNNSYSINLKSVLNPKRFINYFYRIKKIISLAEHISLIQRKKIKFSKKEGAGEEILINGLIEEDNTSILDESANANSKKNEEYMILKEIPKVKEYEDFEFCLRRNIFNLKNRIEMSFYKFFQYKIKIDKVMKDLVEGLKTFCENEKNSLDVDYMEMRNMHQINYNLNENEEEKMENKQFNLNNFLKERKVKKYQDKIKLIIQERINFISFKIFNNFNR